MGVIQDLNKSSLGAGVKNPDWKIEGVIENHPVACFYLK